jgi:excisionase family DNA binding protein
MNEGMLKLSEVAVLMNCAPSTPWRWVRRGILPAVQTPTGMIRVRREDLEDFVRSTTRQQEVKR